MRFLQYPLGYQRSYPTPCFPFFVTLMQSRFLTFLLAASNSTNRCALFFGNTSGRRALNSYTRHHAKGRRQDARGPSFRSKRRQSTCHSFLGMLFFFSPNRAHTRHRHNMEQTYLSAPAVTARESPCEHKKHTMLPKHSTLSSQNCNTRKTWRRTLGCFNDKKTAFGVSRQTLHRKNSTVATRVF